MDTPINPCARCGEINITGFTSGSGIFFFMRCAKCKHEGSSSITPRDALMVWNKENPAATEEVALGKNL